MFFLHLTIGFWRIVPHLHHLLLTLLRTDKSPRSLCFISSSDDVDDEGCGSDLSVNSFRFRFSNEQTKKTAFDPGWIQYSPPTKKFQAFSMTLQPVCIRSSFVKGYSSPWAILYPMFCVRRNKKKIKQTQAKRHENHTGRYVLKSIGKEADTKANQRLACAKKYGKANRRESQTKTNMRWEALGNAAHNSGSGTLFPPS